MCLARASRRGWNLKHCNCRSRLLRTPASWSLWDRVELFRYEKPLDCHPGLRGHELSTDKLHNVRRDIRRRGDLEAGLAYDLFKPDQFPRRSSGVAVAVEDHSIGAIQKLHCGNFEVLVGSIQHGEINVRSKKPDNAVGFHNHVFRAGDFTLNIWNSLAEAALARAHPDGAVGAGDKETRRIGITATVAFVAERAEVIVAGIAVAWFAVGRADAVAELCDFQRGPVILGQSGNEAGDHAGLAHAA